MANPQPLLARLLNTPDLAKIIPQLQPEILHRVIQTCGLEDCAEFVALATPAQLARILDLDIWRLRAPGADEEFDAERFGLWVAVLMESGAVVTAEKLAGLDVDLVVAGLAGHVAVRHYAATAAYTTLDGEHVPGRAIDRGFDAEIGGYVIEARRTSAWEAIVDLLVFLEAEHPVYFHRLMGGCMRLSNAPCEADGFHDLLQDDEQHMFDLACRREGRREERGYVTPAQAHAFLRSARELKLDADVPPQSAIARAYLRAIEPTPLTNTAPASESAGALPETSDAPSGPEPETVAAVCEMLTDAGLLTSHPRALLGTGDPSSGLAWIEAHVPSHPASAEQLAYLANAMLAGCSIQGRSLTPREAADGVAAICNLGLENWPSHWRDRDLIAAFQVGWAILYRDVCMYAAQQLIVVLAGLRCGDWDIDLRLEGLRHQLIRHVRDGEPWRARDALEVLVMLDAPSWAALVGLIDECPVLHAALAASRRRCRTIDPTKFEFVSQNSHIARVREFMASLPSVLMQ